MIWAWDIANFNQREIITAREVTLLLVQMLPNHGVWPMALVYYKMQLFLSNMVLQINYFTTKCMLFWT